MNGRKLTFQLTPLLDLLLIVIFAQYMEVQQKAESAQNDLRDREVQLQEQFAAKQTELEQEYSEREARMERVYSSREADLQEKLDREQVAVSETREQIREHLESIIKQHEQAGTVLAEALNLPGELLKEVLRVRADAGPDQAARLEATVDRMQQVLESRGEELLQFVLRYDEMEKHVSVWEIYIQDNGQALFSDGGRSSLIAFANTEEFVSRAFESSKSFTEPRPLVIILLSYGSPQAVQVRRATDALPLLVERLRKDSGNTRWFDFSLMGYHADGPMFPAHGRSASDLPTDVSP